MLKRDLLNSIKNEQWIVRDWLTGNVYGADNYKEAKKVYNDIFKHCGKGKHETDISLYLLVEEFNNIDGKEKVDGQF